MVNDIRYLRMKEILLLPVIECNTKISKEFSDLYYDLITDENYKFDKIDYLKGKILTNLNDVNKFSKIDNLFYKYFYLATSDALGSIEKYLLV